MSHLPCLSPKWHEAAGYVPASADRLLAWPKTALGPQSSYGARVGDPEGGFVDKHGDAADQMKRGSFRGRQAGGSYSACMAGA
ncbi:MAG TPA: hypothetical protein P5159_25810 [Phycisphaerae bacterium]|nr:hypothetical protein [Phycisphaerae bacterium]